MNNKEIASKFDHLASIMELHGENAFRIKSYTKAYKALRNVDLPLFDASQDELLALEGIGQSTVDKIQEIKEVGEIKSYLKYKETTPEGVEELLNLRGLSSKKLRQIWKETGAESAEQIIEKIDDGTLATLKGFGAKSVASLKSKLEYFIECRPYVHYATLEQEGEALLEKLKAAFPNDQFEFFGEYGRKMNEVKAIQILTTVAQDQLSEFTTEHIELVTVSGEAFGTELLNRTASEEFLEEFKVDQPYATLDALWADHNMQPIVPEYREAAFAVRQSKENKLPKLVEFSDMKGIVHNHSTYSDGAHTLREMCDYVHENGYEYFVISDHSKTSYYANGLKEDRIYQQWEEIDRINATFDTFRTFKGIECDILSDGSLDYDDELLKQFEVVVASVHQGLEMDEKKATKRVAAAIENPHVHILGHSSGRLLLERKGYPLDYPYIIDACAANGVAIELNANPKRLDMDWRWLPYALEKGVMISVNPDAHSRKGIHNIKYGVISARKGGLTADMCLNSLCLEDFAKWIKQK